MDFRFIAQACWGSSGLFVWADTEVGAQWLASRMFHQQIKQTDAPIHTARQWRHLPHFDVALRYYRSHCPIIAHYRQRLILRQASFYPYLNRVLGGRT